MQTKMGDFKSAGQATVTRAKAANVPLPTDDEPTTVVRSDGTFVGPAPITRGLNLGDKY